MTMDEGKTLWSTNRSASSFGAAIAQFAELVGIKADMVFRDAVIDISSRTIMATPVGNPSEWKNPPKKGNSRNALGSGMLRANWQLGFGTIPSGTVSGSDITGTGTIANITTLAGSAGKAGMVAYLVNNLPYALPIEYGAGENIYAPHPNWHGSKQAPAGMVRLSVQQYESEFDQRVAKIAGLS